MKKNEKSYLLDLLYRKFYYFFIRFLRSFKNLFFSSKDHKFVFILSPPYCGSTMLNQFISSSNNVSCNNNIGTREGQLLPGVAHFMFNERRWNEDENYDWQKIKNVWLKYWDHSKIIFLDKSIPNIMRVNEINKVFSPIRYLCMVRNPYAHVEGLMRRNNSSSYEAAMFAMRCLKYQYNNIKSYNNLIFFRYEDLCDNTDKVIGMIVDFVPELYDIDLNMKFSAHNFKSQSKMRMINLNQEKISRISDSDLIIINQIFNKDKMILDFFNYKIETL